MTRRFMPGSRRIGGVTGFLAVAAVVALLCAPGIARAAAPDFYADTIDEGAMAAPTWVETVDVTGDGNLDLVTTLGNYDPADSSRLGLVCVRAGDGDGRFGPATTFSTGGRNPYSLDVADVTGDGVLDIAVANRRSATVTLLQGLGAGVFNLARTIAVGTETIDVKALDLDEDGDLDLAATQMWNDPYTDGTLWLLYNGGSAVFKTVDMPLPYVGGTVMGVGDLNKDGAVDVAVGHAYPPDLPDPAVAGSTESILLNDGLGPHDNGAGWPTTNLLLQPALTVGPYPQGATFADFNADGNMDMCITSRYPNNANIFLGDGTGAFTGPAGITAGVGPYAKVPVAVDLDQDGAKDLAVCNYGNGGDDNYDISVLMGAGDGTFSSEVRVEAGNKPHSVATGDLNEDGWPDLVIPNWKSDDVTVLLNMAPYASDNVDPVTTSSADSAWHTGAVNVTLTATDAASGVAETKYRLDGGSWQSYTGAFSVDTDGDHTLNYYSVDRMGNQESTHTAHVKVDATQPEATLLVPQDGAKYPQGDGAGCDWTRSDATSGVASEVARIDGAVVAKGDPIGAVAEGAHTFSLTVTDVAGNVRTVTTDYDVVVADPATLAASAGPTVLWGKSGAVSAVLKDDGTGAGIGGLTVRFESSTDNAAWTLVDTVTSDSTGLCQMPVAPKARTYYRFKYEGDLDHGPCVSDAITVKVRPLVGKPKGPLKIKARKQFKVTGSLKPQFTAGAKTVKVAIYRLKGGKWRFVKSAYAVNANSGDYSKYTLNLRLSVKGKYGFKATTRTMAAWPSSTSSFSRTTVVK